MITAQGYDGRDPAYDVQEAILPSIKPPVHYIAGSGIHGCLYDHCQAFEEHADAVSDLKELFGLGNVRTARLAKENYLELELTTIERRKGEYFGAEYCEIIPCNCGDPAIHNDN